MSIFDPPYHGTYDNDNVAVRSEGAGWVGGGPYQPGRGCGARRHSRRGAWDPTFSGRGGRGRGNRAETLRRIDARTAGGGDR